MICLCSITAVNVGVHSVGFLVFGALFLSCIMSKNFHLLGELCGASLHT